MQAEYFRHLYSSAFVTVSEAPSKHLLSPDSSLSDAPAPPPKKRRTSQSESSLSDPDDDDEEERPLAAGRTVLNGRAPIRSGKKTGMKKTGGKKIAHTSLPSEQPHSVAEGAKLNGRTNGGTTQETRIKIEEKLDDKQLSRLATGVTVDTGTTAQTPVSHPSLSCFLLPHHH